jgi:hypothetical protein
VEDVERGTDGPRKKKFTIFPDGTVGKDAVGARADPIRDVFAHFRPEETEAEAV